MLIKVIKVSSVNILGANLIKIFYLYHSSLFSFGFKSSMKMQFLDGHLGPFLQKY